MKEREDVGRLGSLVFCLLVVFLFRDHSPRRWRLILLFSTVNTCPDATKESREGERRELIPEVTISKFLLSATLMGKVTCRCAGTIERSAFGNCAISQCTEPCWRQMSQHRGRKINGDSNVVRGLECPLWLSFDGLKYPSL